MSNCNVRNGKGSPQKYFGLEMKMSRDNYYGTKIRMEGQGSKNHNFVSMTAEQMAALVPKRRKRKFFDVNFTPPKSVSIVFGDTDDPALKAIIEAGIAHANTVAMKHIEDNYFRLKIKKDNETISPKGTDMTYAVADHDLSREQQWNVHTHNVVFNHGVDPETGKEHGLDILEMSKAQKLSGQIFDGALVDFLVAHGIPITVDEKGLWEISGITREQVIFFSTRAKDIEEELRKNGHTRSSASAKYKDYISQKLRKPKNEKDKDAIQARNKATARFCCVDVSHIERAIHAPVKAAEITVQQGPEIRVNPDRKNYVDFSFSGPPATTHAAPLTTTATAYTAQAIAMVRPVPFRPTICPSKKDISKTPKAMPGLVAAIAAAKPRPAVLSAEQEASLEKLLAAKGGDKLQFYISAVGRIHIRAPKGAEMVIHRDGKVGGVAATHKAALAPLSVHKIWVAAVPKYEPETLAPIVIAPAKYDPAATPKMWREWRREVQATDPIKSGAAPAQDAPKTLLGLKREALSAAAVDAHDRLGFLDQETLFKLSQVEGLRRGVGVTWADVDAFFDSNKEGLGVLFVPGQEKQDTPAKVMFVFTDLLEAEKNLVKIAKSSKDYHKKGLLTLAQVNSGIDEFNKKFFEKTGHHLKDEQKEMVRHALCGRQRVGCIEGDPGTGKTTGSECILYVMEKYFPGKYTGCSFQGKAAQELQEAKIPSTTIDSLLGSLEKGDAETISRLQDGIIQIDEAFTTSSYHLNEVISIAEKYNCRVFLSGDRKQLQPIGAGAPAELMIDRGLEVCRLKVITRQRDEKIIHDIENITIKDNPTQTFINLDKRGMIVEIEDRTARLTHIAESITGSIDPAKGLTRLSVCATNTDRIEINSQVKAALKASGYLGHEQAIRAHDGTVAYDLSLAVNERVIFLRNTTPLGVKNGECGTVVGFTPDGKIQIQHDSKTMRQPGAKRGGARVPLVITVDPKDYPYLDSAFAVTVHKSQGASIEKVSYVPDDNNKTSANAFLVGITRHKGDLEIVTGNKDRLKSCIVEWQHKPSALEEWEKGYARVHGDNYAHRVISAIDSKKERDERIRETQGALTEKYNGYQNIPKALRVELNKDFENSRKEFDKDLARLEKENPKKFDGVAKEIRHRLKLLRQRQAAIKAEYKAYIVGLKDKTEPSLVEGYRKKHDAAEMRFEKTVAQFLAKVEKAPARAPSRAVTTPAVELATAPEPQAPQAAAPEPQAPEPVAEPQEAGIRLAEKWQRVTGTIVDFKHDGERYYAVVKGHKDYTLAPVECVNTAHKGRNATITGGSVRTLPPSFLDLQAKKLYDLTAKKIGASLMAALAAKAPAPATPTPTKSHSSGPSL